MSGAVGPRVLVVTRRPPAGEHSVERMVAAFAPALPDDLDVEIFELPHESRRIMPRVKNCLTVAKLRADLIHITGDTTYVALAVRPGTACVVTHLDLITFRRYTGLAGLVFRWLWFHLPLRRASANTAISQHTADGLRDEAGYTGDVDVIGVPLAAGFAEEATTRGARPPIVLHVGTDRRKNLLRVIEAMSGLDAQLRIVGSVDEAASQALDRYGVTHSSVSGLSDDELRAEYGRADLLVFASTDEGFGMPIIEAQAMGLPVVTSTIEPMATVSGGAAILANPESVESIREGLHTALRLSPDARQELVEAGHRNAARFTAPAVAASYATIYRRLLAERP